MQGSNIASQIQRRDFTGPHGMFLITKKFTQRIQVFTVGFDGVRRSVSLHCQIRQKSVDRLEHTLLALLAIFLEATPMGLEATSRPSPDLLLCVVAYWSVRRPRSAPAVLVFSLGLVRDLLTDVPVGAGALSLMVISELLKL